MIESDDGRSRTSSKFKKKKNFSIGTLGESFLAALLELRLAGRTVVFIVRGRPTGF